MHINIEGWHAQKIGFFGHVLEIYPNFTHFHLYLLINYIRMINIEAWANNANKIIDDSTPEHINEWFEKYDANTATGHVNIFIESPFYPKLSKATKTMGGDS